MYFFDQLRCQFCLQIVNYVGLPTNSGNLEWKWAWYNGLSPEAREVIDSSWENLDNLKKQLDTVNIVEPYFDNLEKKNWFLDISQDQQQEVRKIEKEIETVLKPFIQVQSLEANIKISSLDSVFTTADEDERELHDMIENTMDKSISIDKASRRVEKLMSRVRNIESQALQSQRYNLVEEEYAELLKSPDIETSQKYIIWEKNFHELTAWDFYALKHEKPELLAWLLLSGIGGNKVDMHFLQSNAAIGSQLRVNFWSNTALDKIVWAGDILPIRDVESVEINGQKGERKWVPRPWYYTPEGEYLAIHNGYKIKILSVEKMDDAQWKNFSQYVEKRYMDVRWEEMLQSLSQSRDEKLIFPWFESDSDQELLKTHFFKKTPKYMREYLDFSLRDKNIPKLIVNKPFHHSELISALNEYKDVRSWIAQYISREKLLDEKNISMSLGDFKNITWVESDNKDFIQAAFRSMLRGNSQNTLIKLQGKQIIISSVNTLREDFAFWGGNLDLREYKHLHPREASLKNNNPSGLTYNSTFMRTLQRHWIKAEKGTARPSREWGNYFSFPNIWEWIKAHNLLWDIKIRKQSHKTLGQLLSTWAVDTVSYKQEFWHLWNTRVSSLDTDSEVFHRVQMKQLKIESPWMYRILRQKDILSSYNTIRV